MSQTQRPPRRRIAPGPAALIALVVGLALIHGATGEAPPPTSAPGPCPAASAFLAAGKAPTNGALVPRRATAVRLCRYAGLNDAAPRSLVAQIEVTDAGTVRQLRAHLNALGKVPSRKVWHCPADDGSGITMVFTPERRWPWS